MARIFGQRPSKIIDPSNRLGNIFAFEFDNFCALIAIEMIGEGKLV
ncbi:MAG: hypothetical protein QXU32_06655 [Nitrososphaerales archaeon]